MGCNATLDDLCQKVWNGERITGAEAVELYSLPLQQLGALADRRRRLAKADDYDGQGNDIVTYRRRNITTPTSAMSTASSVHLALGKQDDSYVITHDEIDKKSRRPLRLAARRFSCRVVTIPGHNGTSTCYRTSWPSFPNQHSRLQPERVYPLSRCIRRTA